MKFSAQSGRVITVHADQKTARECYFASLRLPKVQDEAIKEPQKVHSVTQQSSIDLDPRIGPDERVEPIEERQPLQVGTLDTQLTYLGTVLTEQEKTAIGQVILDNRDLFAWHPSDMPGIDPEFLCHKLSIKVLWAYRCTPQSTNRETPFRLTYGTDAMIPVEVGEPSFRRQSFQEESNDDALRAELDVLEEVRDKAQVVVEACKQRMTRRFNSNLKPRTFHEGDLVWRATGAARRNSSEGKLSANWYGPFRIRHSLHNGAYKLEELSGKVIPRTWNSTHLKTYYS
uniref:Retrotransposable element Tf2 n=1 Tax=Cajanus cajan TaxID=3821 RepID=A0A151QQC7_CAJCA|nr:hypothetical protein KK1_046792 [Cajanus cajan]